jgi:hypothetical protein
MEHGPQSGLSRPPPRQHFALLDEIASVPAEFVGGMSGAVAAECASFALAEVPVLSRRAACFLLSLLLASSCGSDHGQPEGDDTAALKAAAKAELAQHPHGLDPCAAHAWYGDGTCDDFCPRHDPDCDLACPTELVAADGACNAHDPCAAFNDPDCRDQHVICRDLPPQSTDGTCDADDPCAPFNDPDCTSACAGIELPADGVCTATRACVVSDPDCAAEHPVCPTELHPENRRCTAPAACAQLDVDCAREPEACIEIAFATNGECEAAPGCEYTDPADCAAKCNNKDTPQDGQCRGDICDADC